MTDKARYILDTSVVIATFRGDAAILTRLEQIDIAITSTVLGELYFGAHKASRSAEQDILIAGLLRVGTMLPCDQQTAEHYGEIKAVLERKGTRIPDNDIWIAASAIQHNLPLATRDKHFSRISALDIAYW